jgi:alpha-L-rhamnosidase
MLRGDSRFRTIGSRNPVISWAAQATAAGTFQAAFRVTVRAAGEELWDSGWTEGRKQQVTYQGKAFPLGRRCHVAVQIRDNTWNVSAAHEEHFFFCQPDQWDAPWIGASVDELRKPIYFRKTFRVKREIASACLFGCGLGYHEFSINGKAVDASQMDPAHTDYSKLCNFVAFPEIEPCLCLGENVLECVVADGWRRIDSPLLARHMGGRKIAFDGVPQLSAFLSIRYADGTSETVRTDGSWLWAHGPLLECNLYDGTVYDANKQICACAYTPVITLDPPGGKMQVMTLEPIREKEVYTPLTIFAPREGTYVVDFGQNLAGVIRIRLPKAMTPGQTIKIRHAEFLDEDGTLYMAPLRGARCTDTYIASGNGRDLERWQPQFTYHGFRYAQIEGYGARITKDDIAAVALYTDVASGSLFTCGSALLNQIHKNVVMTEKANIHSILTDCPQRDERMGWLNDATVRFEETPYNIDIGRLFPKVVRDILAVQKDGAFTCTVPYVFGGNPADPVCSSFLVAGYEALRHTGNTGIIAEAFDGFAAWEDVLLARSEGYIVNYSYYGDWAGPAYACVGEDGAKSAVTDGNLMSTGYSYLNCKLLAEFAAVIGRDAEKAKYEDLKTRIREAYLRKWFNPETGMVDKGSQASQAFTLWLGLLEREHEAKAARIMHDDLQNNDYRITTGNLCTRYLVDMLAKHGYVDDAYKVLTREEYPSYGFMIQHEATTIWERFELKKNPGMNSHSHPMFGSVGYWFYAYLLGVQPAEYGFSKVKIKPYIPTALLSAQAVVATVKGDIAVKWTKRYGKTYLYIDIPFGVTAEVDTAEGTKTVGSGSHSFVLN